MEKERDYADVISWFIHDGECLAKERKAAAGIAAAVPTTAVDVLPQPPKKAATGLRRTRGCFDCLYALREEHQRIQRIKRANQMVVPPVD